MRISDWSSDVCSSDLGGQLELDQRHEKLDREHEEGEDDQRPGEQEAGDLDEVLAERQVAHQVGDGVEQRTARVEAGDRKSVVLGKRVAVRIELGGSRKNKKNNNNKYK